MSSSVDTNLRYLQSHLKPGPIVPFLGSGVNVGLVPLWPELLKRTLAQALRLRLGARYDREVLQRAEEILPNAPSLFTVYDVANLMKVLLGKRYLQVLRQVIYEKYNSNRIYYEDNSLGEFGFLSAVINLCKCSRVNAVVTYNYDDILLRALTERHPYAVCGTRHTREPEDELPIYYIHGFLPNSQHPPRHRDAKVVLSLDEYFHNMMEPYAWQTTTQLHFLRNSTCLFIGTSLNDINMLRMLNHSKVYSHGRSVFAIMARDDLCKEPAKYLINRLDQQGDSDLAKAVEDLVVRSRGTLLDEVGVDVVISDSYEDMYGLINELAEWLDPPVGSANTGGADGT
jgi:hypothetical protein